MSINFDQASADFQTDTDLLGVLAAANSQSLFLDDRGLPCCTSTAVSEACGVEVELCACI